MAPVRIRYHVPVSPAVSVIRYNDPVKQRNRHRQKHHNSNKHHRLRENRSDFDYDYGPRPDDFEHMRRSVPDKYWGPYNPYIYQGRKQWDENPDDKYYDFKYESNRRYASEGDYRGEYDSEPPPARAMDRDRRYDGRFEADSWPPYDRRDRGYHSHRPAYDSDYEPRYRPDRRPLGGSYDRDYDRYRRDPGRPDRREHIDYHRRPRFLQGEIKLPDERWRPLPYLGDPNRKPHEHRREPHHHSHEYDSPRYHHGHHRKHAHFVSPRSESTESISPYPYVIDDKTVTYTEPPRVALLKKRHRKAHQHGYCDASPEKSSKYIPTMHYDELRCPNCLDKVQNFQDDVLAYPWTVQTFRPQHRFSEAKASIITPSFYNNTLGADHPATKVGAGNTVVSQRSAPPPPRAANKPGTKQATPVAAAAPEDTKNGDQNPTPVANTKKTANPIAKPLPQANLGGQLPQANLGGLAGPNFAGPQNKQNNKGKENQNDIKNNNNNNDATKPGNGKTQSQQQQPQNGRRASERVPLADTANVAPSEPLFRSTDDVMARSKVGGQRSVAAQGSPGGKVSTRKRPGLATLKESDDEYANERMRVSDFDDYDDIRPQDSISNVRLPPLRAYPGGPNGTAQRRMARARAETELTTYSYPSGRYFPRLEYIPPPAAQATPLPRRDDYIDPSRHLRGRYYDRRSGRLYEYDVNYAGKNIYSERRPLLR